MKRRAKEVIADNKEAEAVLWTKVARGSPVGSMGRQNARDKSGERRDQAKVLRTESELFFGLFGEELDG